MGCSPDPDVDDDYHRRVSESEKLLRRILDLPAHHFTVGEILRLNHLRSNASSKAQQLEWLRQMASRL